MSVLGMWKIILMPRKTEFLPSHISEHARKPWIRPECRGRPGRVEAEGLRKEDMALGTVLDHQMVSSASLLSTPIGGE